MKKFEKYLIVSDLDGTFFGEKSEILENNLKALRYFTENGGIFTIASGRDYRTMEEVFPEAKEYFSGAAILCNGVYLYDFQTKSVIDEITLEKKEFLNALTSITQRYPNVGYRISTHEGYICPYISPFMEQRISKILPLIIRDDLDKYLSIPWHKCVFVAEPEIIQEMEQFANSLNMQKHIVLTSFATLLEILPKEAGKDRKIEALKKYYPNRFTICVGDYNNDLDMLKVADLAACPANALDEVKKISKIHLCHHRDGCIADLIYKLDSNEFSTKE